MLRNSRPPLGPVSHQLYFIDTQGTGLPNLANPALLGPTMYSEFLPLHIPRVVDTD